MNTASYNMLLDLKSTAEEGSLRMAAINEWLEKLPSDWPSWSGNPAPLDENIQKPSSSFTTGTNYNIAISSVIDDAYETSFEQILRTIKNERISPQLRFDPLAILNFWNNNRGENQSWMQSIQGQTARQAIAQYEKLLSDN